MESIKKFIGLCIGTIVSTLLGVYVCVFAVHELLEAFREPFRN